nr:hypothetical protein HUO10_005331 [Paraburkholderia busanensis]
MTACDLVDRASDVKDRPVVSIALEGMSAKYLIQARGIGPYKLVNVTGQIGSVLAVMVLQSRFNRAHGLPPASRLGHDARRPHRPGRDQSYWGPLWRPLPRRSSAQKNFR